MASSALLIAIMLTALVGLCRPSVKRKPTKSDIDSINSADERRQKRMARNKSLIAAAQHRDDEKAIKQMWEKILAKKQGK